MHVAIIAAAAALGGLLFGYDTGVISGALLFLRVTFHLSSLMLGVVTSIALAAPRVVRPLQGGWRIASAGAHSAGDRRGVRPGRHRVRPGGQPRHAPCRPRARRVRHRRRIHADPALPCEIALPRARRPGVVQSARCHHWHPGFHPVGYGFAASGAWRWMLGLGAVPGVILAGGMLLLPETPRWLSGHGHAEKARAALRFLRGRHADIEAEVGQLRADLKSTVQALPESRLGHAAARLPLIVGIGLAVFQQVTGINTVIYFAPVIFQASGLSSASAAILATAGSAW